MVLLKRLRVCAVLVAVGLLASACVGLPSDMSWGDVSLIGDPPTILLSFSDHLVEVDPATGSPIGVKDANGDAKLDDQGNPLAWNVQATDNNAAQHFYSRPIPTDDHTLLVASYEGKLLQVDTDRATVPDPTGFPLPGHVVGNPLMTDQLLYVPISDAGLVALDPTNFSTVWQFTGDQGKGVWSAPLLVEDTLYVPAMNHFLFALDAQTGTEKWRLDLEGAVASTPVYANGALYVGSFGRKVFKISTDGNVVASFATNDWVWGTPAVVDDMVYVSDLGGNLYALKDSGSSLDQVWSRKVANGAIRMTPFVSGDTIVVGSRDHNVYWISRTTGDEVFHRETQGEVLSDIMLIQPSGTITEPIIIVSTIAKQEQLVAFTLDQGKSLWAYGS